MKCSVFIASSVDGYIADPEGGVGWLESAGDPTVGLGSDSDMGFNTYIQSVDCMVMGRKSMETISAMNLSREQWPYGNIPIVVLSNTVKVCPENLRGKVEMYAGDLSKLIENLENRGLKHAYIDGGSTITAFLNSKLIDEMTITKAPVLLGEGVLLFGKLERPIKLHASNAISFPNEFVQLKYRVNYS